MTRKYNPLQKHMASLIGKSSRIPSLACFHTLSFLFVSLLLDVLYTVIPNAENNVLQNVYVNSELKYIHILSVLTLFSDILSF